MSEELSCVWCERLFRPRQSGGRCQRFCRPACRRAFHAAARAWVLGAIATGAVTVADLRNDAAATRALLPDAISTASVLAPPQHPTARAPSDETILLPDQLSTLLVDILDTLSSEELGRLPEPVWALLDFIAGFDAIEMTL